MLLKKFFYKQYLLKKKKYFKQLSILLKYYWNFFSQSFFKIRYYSVWGNNFQNQFYIVMPKRQLWFILINYKLFWQKIYSNGSFVHGYYSYPKYFKRASKSILPVILLFWRILNIFCQKLTLLYVSNFNFRILKFLKFFFQYLKIVPRFIVLSPNFITSLVTKRRLKRRIQKLIFYR